jgi:hypothetical protein
MQEQLQAEMAGDKAQIAELLAARKEAERVASWIAEEQVLGPACRPRGPKVQSQASNIGPALALALSFTMKP